MCQRFIPFMALFVFLPMTIAGAADLPPVLYYEITDLEILVTEPNISDPEDYYPDGSAYGVNKWGEAVGNAGHIVGWGYRNGTGLHPRAFLLTPVFHPDYLFADGFESGFSTAWSVTAE